MLFVGVATIDKLLSSLLGKLNGVVTELKRNSAAFFYCLTVDEVHLRRSHETCNEEVLRSVVEILRGINLLDNTVLHNYDSGTKGHCLGLVMGYVDNGSL